MAETTEHVDEAGSLALPDENSKPKNDDSGMVMNGGDKPKKEAFDPTKPHEGDRFDLLYKKASAYLSPEDCQVLIRAYMLSRNAHKGQFRKSGEPFVMHPVETALILVDLKVDRDSLVAALLHDTVEDTKYTVDDIRERFGDTVAELVDGVTKISAIEVESLSEKQANTYRKMMVAMSHDIRVVIIKLADRLHNMRTLMSLKEDRRIFKAKETMEIYAPLANRLGMNSMKWELEDLAFFYLMPAKYQQIQKMVNETREAREAYLDEVMKQLREELDKVGLTEAKIYGRPKHLYSIYQKMANRGKDFSEIYDLIGLRIIVDTIPQCYSSLGAVHSLWHPMPGRFKDYIAMPKFNMYQSLHTTVIGPSGRPLEIQIRTVEMHRMNEYGVAAHWRYKEANNGGSSTSNKDLDEKLGWLHEMLDWQQETSDPQEFLASLKIDLFDNEVFVFTPKGEVMSLRAKSTPLDFAYAIHTEVGNHCVGAKVNGSIVPLNYELQMGDRVEILTQKNASPSRDWFNIVRTPRARSKIRSYFSRITRNDDLAQGHDLILRAARKDGLAISIAKLDKLLPLICEDLGFKNSDEMQVAVGAGKFSARQVVHRLMHEMSEEAETAEEAGKMPTINLTTGRTVSPTAKPRARKKNSGKGNGVVVKGIDDVFVRLSRCCNPLPGDDIIGFITRGRGVSVHRRDCPNAKALLSDPHRIIEVAWEGDTESIYEVDIVVEAIDRLRLLQDIVVYLADQGVNITLSSTITHKDDIVEMHFRFEVSDTQRIDQILNGLRGVDGVFDAKRMLPGTASESSKKHKKKGRS